MGEYVLGTSDHELARLELQDRVWGEVTADFVARCGLAAGAHVADLGAGPGFVTRRLREAVGPGGRVLALDESPRWTTHVERLIAAEGWTNVEVRCARIEDPALEEGSFDLVFLRWVLAFLPDRSGVVADLARCLRPGGALAVLDYNHEGISLFPESEGFRAVVRATRAWYRTRGGDPWTMGEIARLYRAAGLGLESLTPYVLCGGPGSPAFRWAGAFFPYHTEGMRAAGLLSEEEQDRFLAEWSEREADPDALFYSPIVAGAVGRRPQPG